MSASVQLASFVKAHPAVISHLIDLDPTIDKLYRFDLTIGNKELDAATIADTVKFSNWVNDKLKKMAANTVLAVTWKTATSMRTAPCLTAAMYSAGTI